MRDTGEDRPVPQPEGDGTPKFGRLLIVLALAVFLGGVITIASEAYFT